MPQLEAGTKAPEFTLPNQDGTPVSLADFKGQRVLLYFYPADDTPGCTREACQFNDNLAHFQAAGVPVIGISRDDAQSHQRFRNKYGLQFPLLTDADHQVMDAYGAWGERPGSARPASGCCARPSWSMSRAALNAPGTTSRPTATPPRSSKHSAPRSDHGVSRR
jgi:peroxiredoxin Q/BCP